MTSFGKQTIGVLQKNNADSYSPTTRTFKLKVFKTFQISLVNISPSCHLSTLYFYIEYTYFCYLYFVPSVTVPSML